MLKRARSAAILMTFVPKASATNPVKSYHCTFERIYRSLLVRAAHELDAPFFAYQKKRASPERGPK